MLEGVLKTIYGYSMMGPGDRGGVAVSGGADSVALLLILHRLAARLQISLHVLHVDHGWRGEASRADAAFVAALAHRLRLPYEELRLTGKPERGNAEQDARQNRLTWFAQMRAEHGLRWVATGHSLEDQAETVLFRVLRGSGLNGLRGILPVTSEGLVRPLIETSRASLRDWLREQGAEWREDETNSDLSYHRNWIRHRLLPMVKQDGGFAGVEGALGRLARLAHDEEEFWRDYLEPLAADLFRAGSRRGGGLVVQVPDSQPSPRATGIGGTEPSSTPFLIGETARLAELSPAVCRRLIRWVCARVSWQHRALDSLHVEKVLDLIRRPVGSGRLRIPGLDVWRSVGLIRFAPMGWHPVTPAPVRTAPGLCSLGVDGPVVSVACESPLPAELQLRTWRPGDQWRGEDGASEESLKRYWSKSRIPVWERPDWPVIALTQDVVWMRGLGVNPAWARRLPGLDVNEL